MSRMSEQKVGEAMIRMSEREVQVIYLLGEGMVYDEIGPELGISSRTVKSYAGSARAKLGATRARQLPSLLKEGIQRGQVVPYPDYPAPPGIVQPEE